MVKFVSGRPILPAPPRGLPVEITTWASSLHKVLTGLLTETNTAVNQLISQEGRPAFAAYLGTNQTGIAQNTWTIVDIDTEEYDTDGAFDTSNSKFTPKEPGKYLFLGSLQWVSLIDGTLATIRILKGGVTSRQGVTIRHGGAGIIVLTVAVVMEADGVDDWFALQAWQSDSASEDITGSVLTTRFQAHRIGP